MVYVTNVSKHKAKAYYCVDKELDYLKLINCVFFSSFNWYVVCFSNKKYNDTKNMFIV